jgi:hypothetical protein
MEKLYNLLNLEIKKENLTSIQHLIPNINAIFNSTNILNELANTNLIEWKESNYNKKRIDLLSCDEFEFYIITWLPNQVSPIHDHANYGCIMYLMEGTLEEKIYNKKLEVIKTKIINAPHSGYIDNNIGFHSIKCINKAVTLHIYSPGKHKPFLMQV